MGKFDFDFDYEDDITFSDDPTNIECVSELRHYINCHGYTKKLKCFLGKEAWSRIGDIVEYCFGNIAIENVIQDPRGTLLHCKEQRKNKEESLKKNQSLIIDRNKLKNTFCNGLGFKKTKLNLNKLIKKNVPYAEMLRKAFELEDVNIKTKDCFGWAHDASYREKEKLIGELIDVCIRDGVTCGYQNADNYSAKYIIYVELPSGEQLSWHTNYIGLPYKVTKYEKEWDGLVNSSLAKIERYANKMFEENKELLENK